MLGMGCDVVSVARIASAIDDHGDRFLTRCYRPGEIALAEASGPRAAEILASRWAAKEAFVKAIGEGAAGVPYRDVEVIHPETGSPELKLYGRAREACVRRGAGRARLSLSREGGHAVAVVILTV